VTAKFSARSQKRLVKMIVQAMEMREQEERERVARIVRLRETEPAVTRRVTRTKRTTG
jgi:hypothetical protein